ncbi:MAG: hypothetical protein QOJ55_1294 [Solirubrobacteraceae bacterium]|nr:hypothetical protein [Solirubrobacteraceae bacterium]
MRFRLDQALPGSVEEVLAAFTDPAFLVRVGEQAKVGEPEILGQERDATVIRQRVRYRFTGRLSPAVTAVVDRRKLVWVDEHVYDLAAATASFRILPESYADRLRCSGTESFAATSSGTNRHVEAELTVRWPLVGGLVEHAIVSGLQEHLAEEARLVADWITRTG